MNEVWLKKTKTLFQFVFFCKCCYRYNENLGDEKIVYKLNCDKAISWKAK